MTSLQLTKKIADCIFEKRGQDVTMVELKKVSSVTDYFVICTADSNTQVKAIADHIEKELRDYDIRVWHREGYTALQWVLLDYVDVVVHIFLPEPRKFYALEKLWGDAPVKELKDPLLKKPAVKKVKKVEVPAEKIKKVEVPTEPESEIPVPVKRTRKKKTGEAAE